MYSLLFSPKPLLSFKSSIIYQNLEVTKMFEMNIQVIGMIAGTIIFIIWYPIYTLINHYPRIKKLF